MDSNPYQPPTAKVDSNDIQAASNVEEDRTNWTHFVVLAGAIVATLIFALVNAIGEEYQSFQAILTATGIAALSQIPGLIVGSLSIRSRSSILKMLLVPAYLIAATGVMAYLFYAVNGKADSLESSAHMHVILFPVLHCVMAFLAYISSAVFGVISFIIAKEQ